MARLWPGRREIGARAERRWLAPARAASLGRAGVVLGCWGCTDRCEDDGTGSSNSDGSCTLLGMGTCACGRAGKLYAGTCLRCLASPNGARRPRHADAASLAPFRSSVVKKRVYHGTNARFDELRLVPGQRRVLGFAHEVHAGGFFFSPSLSTARNYGNRVNGRCSTSRASENGCAPRATMALRCTSRTTRRSTAGSCCRRPRSDGGGWPCPDTGQVTTHHRRFRLR